MIDDLNPDIEVRTSNMAALNAMLAKYKEPDLRQSLWQIANTAIPFFLTWAMAYFSLGRGYWITLLLAAPAAGLLMRLFIIQHDCGHGSFFRSAAANDAVGSVLGVVTLMPYHYWRKTHAIHHATTGNLDRRGYGDIDTLTVKEYLALSPWKRLRYRIYRSPLVLLGVGGIYQFIFYHRLPHIAPESWRRERLSILLTDLAWVIIMAVVGATIGFHNFLMVQLPIQLIAGAVGVWFFYVQHQFVETYWDRDPQWDFALAGMKGSSYYNLPKILQWFSGNIGFHHIHHLNSRIPNYRLEQCLNENPVLQRVTRLTFWRSLQCALLTLWDDDAGKLVGFNAAGESAAAAHVGAPSSKRLIVDSDAVKSGPVKELDWVNISFLALTPVVAVFGMIWYTWHYGVTWLEIANFSLMFLLTGMSVTGGYHRFYAHKSYECGRPLQLFYLIFGAAAAQNSVLNWASDHRYHHRYVDQEEDPYNILRGGLYAHMGWIFYKDTRQLRQKYRNVPDLMKDPLVVWQDRWYLPLLIGVTFALPMFIGLAMGRPVGGLLWGGFLRVVVVHHMTFFINSLAHLLGTRPYNVGNSARDNWWLAPLTFGEGYHNFHHAFQADYRNGIRWYQFDLTKWWLQMMSGLGLAWKLKRTPEPLIMAARIKVEMHSVEQKLVAAGAPERLEQKVRSRLETGRLRLELAMARYHQARIDYRRQKRQWSVDMRRQWRGKVVQYQDEFDVARARWRDMIQAMNRIPHPSAQGILTFTAILDVFKMRLF